MARAEADTKPKRARKAAVAIIAPVEVIEAFKGFDKDLECRGYQFEVGKTFEHVGAVAACSSGFHSCTNPWDVLGYYGLSDGNRFASVKATGSISRHGGDTKIASASLTVVAELKMPEFIGVLVNWIIDATKGEGDDQSGNGAQIGSSGYGAQIGSSGYDARIGSSGNGARIGSSGNGARIGSSGYDAQIGSSGYDAQIGSSGYGARIGSSGNGARIGSSGYGARIGSSGNGARIGSSGYDARIGSSGNGAQIDASGEYAVIASAGVNARARGAKGAWLSVAEFRWTDERYECLGFATGQAGFDGVPADTWLIAKGGKLVPA